MTSTRIIIMAKEPRPGQVKTRLIPALGAEAAAELAHRLLQYTLEQAIAADIGPVELCVSPSAADEYWQPWLQRGVARISSQVSGDLGARMAAAISRALNAGTPAMLIGTDCPDLTAHKLQQMAALLQTHDSCLCPVADGGYSLLGLQRFAPSLFENIPWSTSQVAALTRQRLKTLGWRWAESDTLNDIDEPDNLNGLAMSYPQLTDRLLPAPAP